MRRVLVLWLTALVVVSIGFGFMFLSGEGTERTSPHQPRNSLSFSGDITWNGTFHMNGYIARGGLDRNVTEFSNATLRIYSRDGELMESWCIGDIDGTRGTISVSHPTRPRYVIYVSPDYWHPDRLDRFYATYYAWEDGHFVLYTWDATPSSLPVNPIAHDAC